MSDHDESAASRFPTFRAAPRWLLGLPWRTARGVARLWRKTWRYTATLLALLILAHIVLNVVASRRLGRELARLRAEGAPLTLAEAAPPKIRDSENAAVLYQKAFKGLEDKDEKWVIRQFLTGKPMRGRTGVIPPPTAAEIKSIIARHEADFRLLEEGSRRLACRFPVEWEKGFEALYPEMSQTRDAIRFLVAKALVDARDGRAGAALNDLATAIRMSNHLSAEPTLVAQLVRVACIAIVSARLPEVLEKAPPTAQESRAFYDLLGQVDMIGPWVHGMEGERACGLWAFDYVRRSPKNVVVMFSMSGVAQDSARARRRRFALRALDSLARVVWMPFLKLDETYFIRAWDETMALHKKPYRESRAGFVRFEKTMNDDRWPRYAIMTRTFFPVFSGAPVARDKAIALIGMMQAALALRAYQVEHGEYPASLAQLKARGGWAIPDDPFSGKPFIYRPDVAQPPSAGNGRAPKGYLIYSVGPDGKDDGGLDRGAAAKRNRGQRGWEELTYDLPLRMER
jgi:hypothetical protein